MYLHGKNKQFFTYMSTVKPQLKLFYAANLESAAFE